MCTLTFFPKTDREDCILTFSRDEQPSRSSVEIVTDTARDLVYPKDSLHGGTWLAMSRKTGRVTCLLNGAFLLHKRLLPYRKSRGLVVLESFEFGQILDFFQNYDFDNIEPFTLITGESGVFYEFKWDATTKFWRKLDSKTPQIWSSATLYDPSVKKRREAWFADFLSQKNHVPTAADLWQFHKTEQKNEPKNGLLMRRASGVCTVSISQIQINKTSQTIDFQYNELENNSFDSCQFAFGNVQNAVFTEGVFLA